ncbi:MAG: response regulator [Candidatus Omnitrophica bacterium]|nr:response regulator [Candidatus Omnitrophota bacterium]
MGTTKKILLVDDERMLHSMMKSVLGVHGFEVVSAMSGEEGLAMVATEKPDLIVLDVMMPKMKGREVCARIKADPTTAHIPVIFLTAKDSDDDVLAELHVGAIGHITKPLNISNFVKLVKQALRP